MQLVYGDLGEELIGFPAVLSLRVPLYELTPDAIAICAERGAYTMP